MQILSSNLKLAEFGRNVWLVTPEAGVTPEELAKPEAWVHVSKNLKAGDRIEVVAADGTWFAELFVRSAVGVGVKLFTLRVVHFDGVAAKAPAQKDDEEFEIKFAGAAKWRGIRKSDGAVMVEGMASREAVKTWLVENVELV